ncbi:MAG: hypothetical protein JRN06_03310 [Nitrososphaerota archaeon]|nr:hypothetical protein [Nitrososphaerota archaeon]MDG7023113.1 hypothetical protein [Nitrososphaerota archaeon]
MTEPVTVEPTWMSPLGRDQLARHPSPVVVTVDVLSEVVADVVSVVASVVEVLLAEVVPVFPLEVANVDVEVDVVAVELVD